MGKLKFFISIAILSTVTSLSVDANPRDRSRGESIIDRLVSCEVDRELLRGEIDRLNAELQYCQDNPITPIESVWSCTAGCRGSGNIGLGSGSTEAEAKRAALTDLGLTCSHHTFDCRQER